ncbi:MAG: CHASE2 domain-containing protein, partial [Leptolyngbyaceae cyanobacterium]
AKTPTQLPPSSGFPRLYCQPCLKQKLLGGFLPPTAIRDRIVLVGITAPEPKDDFITPQQSTLRGLILHAQMVSQLVSAVMDDRPLLWSWKSQGTLLWIATWSTVGTSVTVFSQLITALQKINKFWVVSGMLMVLLMVSYFFFLLGGWVPLVPGAIAIIASYIAVSSLFSYVFPDDYHR